MNLSAVRLPRLLPPPVRRRAEESCAEVERLQRRVWQLAATLGALRPDPASASAADPWPAIRDTFIELISGLESLGDVESALAADEGRWLSQLAVDSPEAGDADAIEYCRDRVDKVRARLGARR